MATLKDASDSVNDPTGVSSRGPDHKSRQVSPVTRVLVCPPTHFGVEYVINPWMAGNVGAASSGTARRQWDALIDILDGHADVTAIEPVPGLPDMCFAANGGLVLDGTFVPSAFSVAQREPEPPCYARWASDAGFEVADVDPDLAFEGEGDALWWPQPGSEPLFWAGYGVRTSLESHRALAECLRVQVVSLRLVDQRFYHLDTCFVPLPSGRVIYYPAAFDRQSQNLIRSMVPAERRIEVDDEDAFGFACNAVRLGNTLITSHAGPALQRRLEAWELDVVTTPLTEFIKAGGAAKCLTLLLDQDVPTDFARRPAVASPIRSQTVEMEGHLLDEGVMTHAFDAVNRSGGSFRLERFHAGERSDQTSRVRFTVSAPTQPRLDGALDLLRPFGAVVASEHDPAVLADVERDGVAPEDFCCSTIYPTDVRVGNEWVRVAHQRMDAAIVVDDARSAPPTARCALMRDLVRGDQVVCGETGVRVNMPDPRRARGEFAFMSSQVTTERRAEVQIEELALEMRRIRARDGRIVVVAGPVVIHTGGGPHLAALVRAGYVQALLTGNALPVHDLETNLFGTSLGVDLNRGTGVQGGHRHHLKTINQIRAAGSIAEAVADGIVTGGIMYECVKAGVPYALAGSIRDDGPLPDTHMDLVAAQEAYARLIEDADLILMLSTMLHAIGTGNMTPAGVRLVCVDINPAVATKLADRGSVESTGIVTDVGLFLNLLARSLDAG